MLLDGQVHVDTFEIPRELPLQRGVIVEYLSDGGLRILSEQVPMIGQGLNTIETHGLTLSRQIIHALCDLVIGLTEGILDQLSHSQSHFHG